MVAKFLDDNQRELRQQRQRERQKKAIKFILVKQLLCTCITLFALLSAIVARLRHETSYFTEWVNTTQKVIFSFLGAVMTILASLYQCQGKGVGIIA